MLSLWIVSYTTTSLYSYSKCCCMTLFSFPFLFLFPISFLLHYISFLYPQTLYLRNGAHSFVWNDFFDPSTLPVLQSTSTRWEEGVGVEEWVYQCILCIFIMQICCAIYFACIMHLLCIYIHFVFLCFYKTIIYFLCIYYACAGLLWFILQQYHFLVFYHVAINLRILHPFFYANFSFLSYISNFYSYQFSTIFNTSIYTGLYFLHNSLCILPYTFTCTSSILPYTLLYSHRSIHQTNPAEVPTLFRRPRC